MQDFVHQQYLFLLLSFHPCLLYLTTNIHARNAKVLPRSLELEGSSLAPYPNKSMVGERWLHVRWTIGSMGFLMIFACLPTHTFNLVDFYGTWRERYHTQILWVRVTGWMWLKIAWTSLLNIVDYLDVAWLQLITTTMVVVGSPRYCKIGLKNHHVKV